MASKDEQAPKPVKTALPKDLKLPPPGPPNYVDRGL